MLWTLLALGCPSPPATARPETLTPVVDGPDVGRPAIPTRWTRIATGFAQVTDVQFVPGQGDRAVVLEKTGDAWLADFTAQTRSRIFHLDVETSSELGLLGLAFHPRFPAVPKVYTNATTAGPTTQIRAWTIADPTAAEWVATPGPLVLEQPQPFANHNAGQLAFGPDGMLYIGFGDGGAGDDPHGYGQDRSTWLGKMLRVDVDGAPPYQVPADNPFVGDPATRPEIWALGLRNPWRYSFAPDGRLVVADVGQNRWEEVDLVPRGANLGWDLREGRICHEPPKDCPIEGLVEPIAVYGRNEGTSVTGGHVVTAPGPLAGKYVFGDFGSGRVWALDLPTEPGTDAPRHVLGSTGLNISTFAKDAAGQIVLADFGSGSIYRWTAP